MAEGYQQVNVNLEVDDISAVDKMMKDSGIDNRSAFMRWLVRQEVARRYSQPNPAISVEQAMAAGE
jgi:metal-responsive CopG/Arc/MetJ family transcriptional regulator